MSRLNPARLFGFLAILLAVMGGLALAKGSLQIAQHEGDTLHLIQIVTRLTMGQWPHLDFMTPLGILAYAPIAFFLSHGAGIGHAILYAQITVGAILLPAAWWVGVSRLRGPLAYLFGAIVIALTTALVFGTAERTISISMHYNRWAWAISFIAVALAVLPPIGRERAAVDGIIIGLCMSLVVLIKLTYFVALAPGIVLALVLHKSWRTLVYALVVGLVVAGATTAFIGLDYWLAYIGDLLQVAHSEVRPRPGQTFRAVLQAPAFLGPNLITIAGLILLRQSDRKDSGLVMLVLLPGFVYVTYQNFGNDPIWIALVAVLLFALRPTEGIQNKWGWDIRAALTVTAVAALAFAFPSLVNMLKSPLRQLSNNSSWYKPIIPNDERYADLQVLKLRYSRVDGRQALDGKGSGLEFLNEDATRPEATILNGEELPRCELKLGLPGWLEAIVRDMEAAGYGNGSRVFAADLFSSHWMYGDLEPLDHGAPWYYGGLPGIEDAQYLLVPMCPADPDHRRQILKDISERKDLEIAEVHRSPLYILFEIKHLE